MPNQIPPSVSLGLFALLSGLLLTGCQTLGEEWNWSDVPDRKEPRAELTQIQHSVGFAAGSAHMATRRAGEAEELSPA